MALALQILASGFAAGAVSDGAARAGAAEEVTVDDDVYFARFRDMTYAPVKNDPLSATLPTILQTQ